MANAAAHGRTHGTRYGPVFIVGALRSGTTMLRLMLDGHPELHVPFEFDFAVDSIAPDGSYPPVDRYVDELTAHRIFLAAGLSSDRALDYPSLVQSYLEQARVRGGKRLIGATVHRHLEWLPGLWPDARFVHLLRDGRDVARSVVRMGWAGNTFVGADTWLDAERSFDRLSTRISSQQLHEIRYEQLVYEPEPTLRELCTFLDLDYDPAMLRYAERSTYSPPNPNAAAGWQRDARGRREAILAERRLGPMLAARGYRPCASAVHDLSRAERSYLKLDSRLRSLWFRVQRQGPGLTVMDLLIRRLPLVPRSLRHAVQHCLNRVEAQHLK